MPSMRDFFLLLRFYCFFSLFFVIIKCVQFVFSIQGIGRLSMQMQRPICRFGILFWGKLFFLLKDKDIVVTRKHILNFNLGHWAQRKWSDGSLRVVAQEK